MKINVLFSLLVILLLLDVVHAKWCNETKTELKTRFVKYEEVVTKRKSSVMCRIKGFRDKSCTIKEVHLKERPETFNSTSIIPKCCDGFALLKNNCLPICSPPCDLGKCIAPNVCQKFQPIIVGDKEEADYYDENDKETSTPSIEEVDGISTSTEPEEVSSTTTEEDWETTTAVDYVVTTEDEEEDLEENSLESVDNFVISIVIWISIFVSVVIVSILSYVIFLKFTKQEVDEAVVQYKR